ncbi:hypothetical protein Pth03_35700 [Planotetraspora thailandica]|uniref:carbonic anhydrase n=1 Tax=Planotetraspora thailandica TaxID=487172 RepID=A0A8J3V1V1_9ACTN|nr:carbonic anhydrase family protein [Planotetraspora thailandica]GII55181.1 hypothetical protein Pth03_35700 [Planotetraspora thailandica]
MSPRILPLAVAAALGLAPAALPSVAGAVPASAAPSGGALPAALPGASESGPAATARRKPACKGTDQAVRSPVEIDRSAVCKRPVPALVLHYPRHVDGQLVFQDKAPVGGHPSEHDDIRFVIAGPRPHITFGGERYTLNNVHFHGHAEHRFAGERYAPVEAHLVHEKATGERGYVVLSVLLDASPRRSEHDRLLASPPPLGSAQQVRNIHLKDLLPKDRTTYRYTGSLTTPDETGDYFRPVNWVVFGEHAEASRASVHGFRSLWPEGEGNVRELQVNVPPPNISVS